RRDLFGIILRYGNNFGFSAVIQGCAHPARRCRRTTVTNLPVGSWKMRDKDKDMTGLTHAYSPLDQARRHQRVSLGKSRRQLPLAQQAILKRILEAEKYDYVRNDLFDRPHAEAEKEIFVDAPDIPKPDTSWYHPVMDNFHDTGAPRNA